MVAAEEKSTQQRILEAVITGIEKYGIDQLTTRKIAEEAEANIASINYYFRSKDELVTQALQSTAEHMLADVKATLDEGQGSLREVLEEIFFYMIEGAARYPNITTAHVYPAIVEKDYASPGARALRDVFEQTVARVEQEVAVRDPAHLRLVLSQVFGALTFATLAPNFYQEAERADSHNLQHLRRLAGLYTDLVLREMGERSSLPPTPE